MANRIPLTQGYEALVDDVDYEEMLWDYCGFDLLYTYEDGLAMPGNWPVAGASSVYEALGIPIY